MLEVYRQLLNVASRGERAVLATVISSRGSAPRTSGAKMLIKGDGTIVGTIGGGGVEKQVVETAIAVISSGESQIVHLDLSGRGEEATMICGGQMDVFLDPIEGLETLYLFGAGHIAQSTAAIARMLGFRVVVIDPRPEYNNRDRFADADALIVEDYDSAFPKLSVDEGSYIVIYTPGHRLDEECLRFALGTEAKSLS